MFKCLYFVLLNTFRLYGTFFMCFFGFPCHPKMYMIIKENLLVIRQFIQSKNMSFDGKIKKVKLQDVSWDFLTFSSKISFFHRNFEGVCKSNLLSCLE